MEFELLAEAPLFALDVLGPETAPVRTDMDGGGIDWPLRQTSNTGLSDVLTSMLMFDESDGEGTPATRTSSKRSYYEADSSSSDGSPMSDSLLDDLSVYNLPGDYGSSPKRARSSSFEEILNDLPTPSVGVPLAATGATTVTCDSERQVLVDDPIFVFPPGDSKASTPTHSPTKGFYKSVTKPTACSVKATITIESTTKPNFLKPLTPHERRMLGNAGTGACIIRYTNEAQ